MKACAAYILYGSDLIAVRFLLGLAEITWAATLYWPGLTFGRPTYSVMAQIAPEDVWALLFFVTGVIQFKLLFSGELHSARATWFAAWNCNFWFFTVLSMYMSVYPPPAGISGELALAVGSIWVFLRSGVPAIGKGHIKHGLNH